MLVQIKTEQRLITDLCCNVKVLRAYRMYAVYRQAHSPTAIEFSVYCNFISNVEKNLVVAGTSQLYVYRIIHDVEVKEFLARFIFHFSITDLKSTVTDCNYLSWAYFSS